MKIIQLWNNKYPWDIRIEKFSRTLINQGHELHLICNNIIDKEKSNEFSGLTIHTISTSNNKHLNSFLSFPVSPLWISNSCHLIKKYNIDAIIIRDLPLMFSGLIISWLSKKPAIFDMAENYPAMWREISDRSGLKLYNHLLRNTTLAEMVESFVVKHTDHTIVVVEESRDRILEKGVPQNKISIVGNTPDLTRFNILEGEGNNELFSDRFKLVYTGFVDSGRGLDTVIQALPLIKAKIDNILLIIAGGGDLKVLNDLKKLTIDLGIQDHVHFTDWLSHNQIPKFIRHSDICIVPHNSTPMTNSTIPNKLFDYMYFSKPVIVSDASPLKRIVSETNCGAIFKSREVQDFTQKVLELKNQSEREKFGHNGHKAIISKYNWDNESRNLLKIFQNLNMPTTD